MEGIERNLLTKNRDRWVAEVCPSQDGWGGRSYDDDDETKRSCAVSPVFPPVRLPRRFTQNLSVFRREVNDSMKNSTYGVNSNDMMS